MQYGKLNDNKWNPELYHDGPNDGRVVHIGAAFNQTTLYDSPEGNVYLFMDRGLVTEGM